MPTYKVKTNDKQYEVVVTDSASGGATVKVDDHTFEVEVVGAAPAVAQSVPPAAAPMVAAAPAPAPRASTGGGASGSVNAPIPGVVTKILVKVGDSVNAGQTVLRLEAMKMENDIAAASAGTVKEIAVSEGSEVSDGQLLLVVG